MDGGIKGLLSSKTIWAVIIALLAKIIATKGFVLTPEVQAGLVGDILQVVQYGGMIAAAIFRVTATKQIVIGGGG